MNRLISQVYAKYDGNRQVTCGHCSTCRCLVPGFFDPGPPPREHVERWRWSWDDVDDVDQLRRPTFSGPACGPLARLFDESQPDVDTKRQMRALCQACPLLKACRQYVAELPLSPRGTYGGRRYMTDGIGFAAGMTHHERMQARGQVSVAIEREQLGGTAADQYAKRKQRAAA